MLFRTVYGSELNAIYSFVMNSNGLNKQPNRLEIHNAFIPKKGKNKILTSQNVDDAISFLRSANLIHESSGQYFDEVQEEIPFPIKVLQALRCLEFGKLSPLHPLDCFYLTILDELFIKADQTIREDFHALVNQIPSIQAAGGLGKEKLQGWMRVMEYLGVGRRIQGNFMCMYSPTLLMDIISLWKEKQGTLQSFFETYFETILPYSISTGDLSQAIRNPMQDLANNKYIELYPLQDSPTRPYFGQERYRGFARRT
jgi:hypothetical protein